MNRQGAIIIIEDDADDQVLLAEAFKSLNVPNKLVFFFAGVEALQYLQQPNVIPFLIISDIKLPALEGLELKERIFQNKEISRKCIPYIFFTTAVTEKAILTAYAVSAQGFFLKPTPFAELVAIIKSILEYWTHCYTPNRFI